MYLEALCAMCHLKWKGVNPNSWVRVCAALYATPPTPVAPFTCTYISFWYWHHFLMPKATRELQKRSRTATTVGQGKRLALVFLLSPGRDTPVRAHWSVLREEGNPGLLPVARCSLPRTALVSVQPFITRLRIPNSEHCSSDLWT